MMIVDRVRSVFGANGDGIAGMIVRGGAVSLGLAVSGVILGFASQVLLSRTLGVTEFGHYAILLGWCLMLAVPASAGLDFAVLRFAPAYFQTGDDARLRSLGRFAAVIQVGVTALIGIGLLATSVFFPAVLSQATPVDAGWMVLLILATVLLGTFSTFFRGIQQIFLSQFYQQTLRSVLLLGTLVAIIWAGGALDAHRALVVTSSTAAMALAALLAHFVLVFIRGRRGAPADPEPGRWIAYGGRALANSLLQQVLVQTPVILLGILSTTAEAGKFAAAARLSVLVTFGLSALASITAPMIVTAHQNGDGHELARIAKVNARLATLSAGFACLLFVVAGKTILGMFGAGFVATYPALLVLLCSTFFNAFSGAAANLLLMTDRQDRVLGALALSMLVYASGAVILMPEYGATGGAVAVALGVTVCNAVMIWQVRRTMHLDCTAIGQGPIS